MNFDGTFSGFGTEEVVGKGNRANGLPKEAAAISDFMLGCSKGKDVRGCRVSSGVGIKVKLAKEGGNKGFVTARRGGDGDFGWVCEELGFGNAEDDA